MSAAESGRCDRSMVNEIVTVECGGIVTTPLCGISHGTSDVTMPVSVASPLFVKSIVPLEDVTSTRFFAGCAVTVPEGGAADRSRIGICRPDATPFPDGVD